MGETRRGERGTFVARLGLKRLLQDKQVKQGDFIDVSNRGKWSKLFADSNEYTNKETEECLRDLFHQGYCEQNSNKA